jgi:hypothetical protein
MFSQREHRTTSTQRTSPKLGGTTGLHQNRHTHPDTRWVCSTLMIEYHPSSDAVGRHFIQPKVSLPCSQERITGPYPQPDESTPYPNTPFLNVHFNIICPSTSSSSKWSLPSRNVLLTAQTLRVHSTPIFLNRNLNYVLVKQILQILSQRK